MHKVSILTPTWNRVEFLSRVHDGLCNQSNELIEWIVVDDGSSDGTEQFMRGLLKTSTLSIVYAKFNERVGKCRADNLLLDLASNDFVLWCDSDDLLLPGAINSLLNEWSTIPDHEKYDYIGIAGLCSDTNGVLQSTNSSKFSTPSLTCSWYDLDKKYNISGDMCILINRRIIGNERFPEHDLVITEAAFWVKFFHLKIKLVPRVFKIMIRTTDNRISGSNKMQYSRGKAHAVAIADSPYFSKKSLLNKIKITSKFHRYCIHGDITLQERSKIFKSSSSFFYYFGALLGLIQAIKDITLNRVEKTHLIFEKGRNLRPIILRNYL